jgi:hypothetical protein
VVRDYADRLFKASKMLGVRLLDQIIIGNEAYYSLADAGLISAEILSELAEHSPVFRLGF